MSDKQEARIHIDRTPYRSPNPTDGEALYLLGKVKAGYALFEEVQGNEEDKLIPGVRRRFTFTRMSTSTVPTPTRGASPSS